MRKQTALFLTIMLISSSALAGGGHEGTTTYGSSENTTTNSYNNNYDKTRINVPPRSDYFYLGGEAGWLKADTKGGYTGDDEFWTLAPIVGLRIGDYFGAEASYTWSTSENDSTGGDVNITDYAVDAMGYLPLNDARTFDLVGLVGIGHYKFDSDFPGDDSDTAIRYGGGFQYDLNPNWSTRVLYRRAEVDTSALDSVDTVTLGLTYNFR